MKIASVLSVLLLCSCAQKTKFSIDGIWQDSPNPDFSNCYASFQIQNKEVIMMHFFHYKGKPFFETGKGTFKDGVLEYNVEVLQTIDDWPTTGFHKLTLSPDGQRLEGFYISSKGQRGPLTFHKK